jgi:hypothetical protein
MLLVMTALVVPLPVLAHSDEGEMTVTLIEQSGPQTITLEVGVVFADDGHLAEEATVAADLIGPSNETVGPVAMPRISGARYGAEITVPGPGSWTVSITSENPGASAEATIEVVEEASTTTAPTTTTGSEPGTTTLPSAPGTTQVEEPTGGSGLPIAAVAVAGLVVGGGIAYFRRRGTAD